MSRCVVREATNLAAELLKLEQPRMCSLMAKRVARNVSVGYIKFVRLLTIATGMGRKWLWHFDNLITGSIVIAPSW
jgi:hypothetical protein